MAHHEVGQAGVGQDVLGRGCFERYGIQGLQIGASMKVTIPVLKADLNGLSPDHMTEDLEIDLAECCDSPYFAMEWVKIPTLARTPFVYPQLYCRNCGHTQAVGSNELNKLAVKSLEHYWNLSLKRDKLEERDNAHD